MASPKERRSSAARRALCVAVGAGALLASRPAEAEGRRCVDAWPWSRLGRSAREFARPVPLALTGAAVAVLPAFSPTGADHWIRVQVQTTLGGQYNLEHVSLTVPYAWGVSALVAWLATKTTDAPCLQQRTTAAVVQAIATTFGVVSVLKFSVGRTWPNGGQDPNAPDRLSHPEYAKDYAPFQLQGLAWPSGHTAVSFAIASSLREVLPRREWVRWIGYPIAAGIGIGMVWGDHHWTSDVISGGLLGEAIGGAVGRAFHDDAERPRSAVEWTVMPMQLPGEARGVAVTGSF